jgi:hypothetical protein
LTGRSRNYLLPSAASGKARGIDVAGVEIERPQARRPARVVASRLMRGTSRDQTYRGR